MLSHVVAGKDSIQIETKKADDMSSAHESKLFTSSLLRDFETLMSLYTRTYNEGKTDRNDVIEIPNAVTEEKTAKSFFVSALDM